MRTFAELRAFVRIAFTHTFDEPPLIKVRVQGTSHEETVGMAVIDYATQPCVLVMLDVCGEDALSPARALELNRDIGPASLVPVGGRYLLRQVMPLSETTAPFLRWTCCYVVDQARRVHDGLGRNLRGDAGCYAHFVE